MSNLNPIELAEDALNNLEYVTGHGLPECYDSVADFMIDFYPDLPWDYEGLTEAVNYMLRPEAWAILQEFTNRFGYNIISEFKELVAKPVLN